MFKGIQKTSLVDFPGRIAATLFTGGCNFRCPWCHNFELVDPTQVSKLPDLSITEVFSFLETRIGKLDGVCVTGGEPTLWGDKLIDFFKKTKEMGYQNKLDTNGYLPNVLEKILLSGGVDFVAMDIKNSPQKYAETVGIADLDFRRIQKSIQIIQESGVEYEFRTTLVPDRVTSEDISQIQEIIGHKPTLQPYFKPVKSL